MSTLEHVNLYRSLGLCVLPAVYGQKNPSINWKLYQKRKPADGEIQGWFNDGRRHNIAIICGAVSDNLVVLDFDDLEVYRRFFDSAKIEAGTIVVKTGSGKRHVYTRTPISIASFRIPELKLEARSNGNIVIAPPSLHPSGNRYEFVNPQIKKIADVENLERAIWSAAESKFGVHRSAFALGILGEDGKKRGSERRWRGPHPPCIKKLVEGVGAGSRNMATLALASYFLFWRGSDMAKVQKRLLEWNRRNRPPQSGRKVSQTLREVQHRGYVFGCRGLAAFCDRDGCPLEERRWKSALKRSGVGEFL